MKQLTQEVFASLDFPRCFRPFVTFSSREWKVPLCAAFYQHNGEERPRKAFYSKAFILAVDLVLRKVVASTLRCVMSKHMRICMYFICCRKYSRVHVYYHEEAKASCARSTLWGSPLSLPLFSLSTHQKKNDFQSAQQRGVLCAPPLTHSLSLSMASAVWVLHNA